MTSMLILKKDRDCSIMNALRQRKSVAKLRDSVGTFVCLDHPAIYWMNSSEVIRTCLEGHPLAKVLMVPRKRHLEMMQKDMFVTYLG
jgi:hypothetical protein